MKKLSILFIALFPILSIAGEYKIEFDIGNKVGGSGFFEEGSGSENENEDSGGNYEGGNVYFNKLNDVYKLNSEREQDWVYVGVPATVTVLEVDDDGSVYVGRNSGLITKVDTNGDKIWSFEKSLESSGVISIDVKQDGVIYATFFDDTMRKISDDGTQLWKKDAGYQGYNQVETDASGNIYTSVGNAIKKFDSSGNVLRSFYAHTDDVVDVTVDSNGNIYSASFDSRVKKINSSGDIQWSYQTERFEEEFHKVEIGDGGNLYVASGDKVARVDTENGERLWRHSGAGRVTALKVGPNGDAYVGHGDSGFMLEQYDSEYGVENWSNYEGQYGMDAVAVD